MENSLQGKTALITGASSGMGADFARQLAARGCSLILVARRTERLLELEAEIVARHPVPIECVTMDLVDADAPLRLYDQLKAQSWSVDILVNNAGFGTFGEFAKTPWENIYRMLELDMVAVTHLTRLFMEDMVTRQSGYILFIASIGSFQPSPTYAAYSAAKSYVLSLGEALHYELRRTGVHCTVLCPGVTRTEFHQVAGQRYTLYQRMTMMKSSAVVRIGIEAMLRGRSCVVAGRFNSFFALATRLMPRQMLAGLASWAMREPSK
jgi:uncharacterized protein